MRTSILVFIIVLSSAVSTAFANELCETLSAEQRADRLEAIGWSLSVREEILHTTEQNMEKAKRSHIARGIKMPWEHTELYRDFSGSIAGIKAAISLLQEERKQLQSCHSNPDRQVADTNRDDEFDFDQDFEFIPLANGQTNDQDRNQESNSREPATVILQ